jgi:hypothetical protein
MTFQPLGVSRPYRKARHAAAVLLAVAGLTLACVAAGAQDISKWRSFDPKAGILPLDSGFRPGQYMIYVANSDPNGRVVSRWNNFGPLTLQAGDRWDATLMPSAQLRLEKAVATSGDMHSGGAGRASIYARNGDIAAWQSICVLPVGVPVRPNCFGGTMNVVDGGQPNTFSQWASITPDHRQFEGQPGGVIPLIVRSYPQFLAGSYMIYVANSDPHGMTISRWNTFGPVTLKGHDKWAAVLLRNAQLRLEKNEAALLPYATPDSQHAMIYTRNDDFSSWHSICVLPVGMTVEENCFGGSNNIVHVGQKPTAQTTILPPQRSPQGPAIPPTVPQSGAPGATTAGGAGGIFAGEVTIRRGDAKPGVPGTIELTVRDGKVSGSMTWPPGQSRMTARFAGAVGADLRMTARVDGNSEWLGNKPTGYSGPYDAGKAIRGNIDGLLQFATTYPFSGELTGRMDGGGWTGTYQARSTDKRNNPVMLRGTWKAAPKK